jgi:hypothetical protein
MDFARPHEVDFGPDRLRPEGNRSRRMIDLGLAGGEEWQPE